MDKQSQCVDGIVFLVLIHSCVNISSDARESWCWCINPALTLIVRLSLSGSQLSNTGGPLLPAWYGDWFYHREAGHWYLVLSTRSPLASSHLNPSLDNSQLESKHNLFCHQWKFSCILQELCLQPSTKILLLEERRSVVGKVSVWFETRSCFVFHGRVELQEGWLGGGWRANYQVSVWKSSAPTS